MRNRDQLPESVGEGISSQQEADERDEELEEGTFYVSGTAEDDMLIKVTEDELIEMYISEDGAVEED